MEALVDGRIFLSGKKVFQPLDWLESLSMTLLFGSFPLQSFLQKMGKDLPLK